MDKMDPDIQLISSSNFAFSNALHERLRIHGQEGNLVFSPFSLGLVLLMARFGARGKTAEQLDRVLNPIGNATLIFDDFNPLRRGFFKVLNSIKDDQSSDYNVTLANRMFTGLGFNVKDEFKNVSRATLGIKVEQLDFTEDRGRPAAEAINAWVWNETNGKINEIISSDSLANQTQVILVNAIHFKAPWELAFQPQDTRKATFHLNSNEQTEVAMMTAEDKYAHGDLHELNATVVIIPYSGERFSMHVYVPKERDGLNDLLHGLKNTSLGQIRGQLQKPGNCEEVQLSLPKFKIQSDLKLLEPLKEMGAVDMFSSTLANFTGISDEANVYVSEVVQKAFITVDEAGTEAAAASSIQTGLTCFPSITIVNVDRPFYFQIVEDQTDLVLFAGTVRMPEAVAEGDLLPAGADCVYDDEYDYCIEDTNVSTTPAPTKPPTLSPPRNKTVTTTKPTTITPTTANQTTTTAKPTTTTTPMTKAPTLTTTTPMTKAPTLTTTTPMTKAPTATTTTPKTTTTKIRKSPRLNPVTEHETKVIFATYGGGIKAYSDVTNIVTTVIESSENFTGVAWDSINQNLYFSSKYAIYRANIEGTTVQTVLNTTKYGAITGLAFDWITSNLYGVSKSGVIFACKSLADGTLSCETVTDRRTHLLGIALSPNEGLMYLTEYAEGMRSRIVKADLDGNNPAMIVRGLYHPYGITVDFHSSSLMWTEYGESTVRGLDLSVDSHRTFVRKVANWMHGNSPTGIAVNSNGKVFWGTYNGGRNLHSGNYRRVIRNPQDVHIKFPVGHLTLATENIPNMTRPNHCEKIRCGKVCVLTPEYARCLR